MGDDLKLTENLPPPPPPPLNHGSRQWACIAGGQSTDVVVAVAVSETAQWWS